MEIDPATTAATPATRIVPEVAPGAAATPRTMPEVDMIPSFAPRTPALSQLSLAAMLLRLNSDEAITASSTGELGLVIVQQNTTIEYLSSKAHLTCLE
jgi:hypothetical protein